MLGRGGICGFLIWLCAISFQLVRNDANESNGPRYFHTPMHEVMQHTLYVKTTSFDEVVVAYADKGSDLRENDYLTHADGVRILNGGLQSFLKSGDKEAIVPIIEESDSQHGGSKFLGFVLVQVVQPRKLSTRRGEVVFDLEEGGPAPTMNLGNIVVTPGGAKTTSDPSYQPPPHGTGACITGRDCYFFNGTCVSGQCSCLGAYTGTYCQLNRPEMAAAAIMKKRAQTLQQKQHQQKQEQQLGKPRVISDADISEGNSAGNRNSNNKNSNNPTSDLGVNKKSNENIEPSNLGEASNANDSNESGSMSNVSGEKKKKKKKKAAAKSNPDGDLDISPSEQASQSTSSSRSDSPPEHSQAQTQQATGSNSKSSPNQQQQQQRVTVLGDQSMDSLHFPDVRTVEEVYGDSPRRFPLPNAAGRLPNVVLNDRHRLRHSKTRFVYAVRFRVGPFGLVFDNKPNNATIVESVVKGGQAEQSDVQPGDRLVAIDMFDISAAPAKLAQRILSSLSWPIVLAFETQRADGNDPQQQLLQQRRRSFNLTVLYPPHLAGEYPLRVAEWSPALSLLAGNGNSEDKCPVYRLTAPQDLFACPTLDTQDQMNELFALSAVEKQLMESRGFVDATTETQLVQAAQSNNQAGAFRFLALLLQESFIRKAQIDVRSAVIAKRGVCTFVDKAILMSQQGAQLGLVVNADNELLDAPAGKSDKPEMATAPLALLRQDDGLFLHLSALAQNVFFTVKPAYNLDTDRSESRRILELCETVVQTAEDVLDRWPHSIPDLSLSQILAFKPPDQSKVRGLTEEGGRLVLAGSNGWAFFDYHLAMFGPQEVPAGSSKFVLAQPAYGCDPNAYTVRVTNATVGILRGGGCSFGIKVINAQKLGAKAVVIINTDDEKTMRLMALPDEVPLVKIPCVMASRRLQFYVEAQLKRFAPADHLLVALQPTGVFGEYEKKNTLTLPQRIDTLK